MGSAAQPVQALARANEIRVQRAEIRRAIAARTMSVADALEHEACQTQTVVDLLRAQPRWGHKRAATLVHTIPMSESKRVGDLTDRQRHALVAAVDRGPAQ